MLDYRWFMKTNTTKRRRPRHMLAVASLLLIGACDDSPTAAFGELETIWVYEMSVGEIGDTPEPGDLECRVTDATLMLAGRRTFSGTIEGGLSCVLIGDEFDVDFSDHVGNGFVEGDSVQFRIGTWQHEGTFSDSMMTGSVDVIVGFAGDVRTVTGAWTATRQ